MSNFFDRREKYFKSKDDYDKKYLDNIYKISKKDVLALIWAAIKIILPLAMILVLFYFIIILAFDKLLF